MTGTRDRLREAFAHLPYLPRVMTLVWSATRGWTAAWIALLVVQGLLPVATVYLTRALVNRLVVAVGAGGDWTASEPVFLFAAAYGAVFLVSELLSSAGRWIRTAQSDLIRNHITGLIHQKSIVLDLAFYELPEFYDRLHRARDESGNRSIALLDGLAALGQSSITMVAMIGVLLPFGPWLALALVVNTIPAIYVVVHHARLEHRWWLEHTEDVRLGWYFDWLLTTGVNAAEVRAFGLGPHFCDASQRLREHLRTQQMALVRDRTIAESTAALGALVVGGGAGIWLIWKTLRGLLTLGDLALAYQAFQSGLSLMRTLLGSVGQLYANMLFLGSLFEFLGLSRAVVDSADPRQLPAPLAHGIRFCGVSFRYPGSTRAALERLDLVLPAGRWTAIVGPNGAGKSTLIKLLCRFYDPASGTITFDDVDVRDVAQRDLRRAITVVFQQPIHFQATLADNVRYGDLASDPDRARVAAAAAAAGADGIALRLPRGYDTMLGRWLSEGTELSVGEWQRIALGRAFIREAPILLLDEPTSAMDSWAENDWLDRFHRLAAGRTTLMITHRFTTAMRADVIHVMVEGRVIESGTHDELVARRGYYAESWAAQMATGTR